MTIEFRRMEQISMAYDIDDFDDVGPNGQYGRVGADDWFFDDEVRFSATENELRIVVESETFDATYVINKYGMIWQEFDSSSENPFVEFISPIMDWEGKFVRHLLNSAVGVFANQISDASSDTQSTSADVEGLGQLSDAVINVSSALAVIGQLFNERMTFEPVEATAIYDRGAFFSHLQGECGVSDFLLSDTVAVKFTDDTLTITASGSGGEITMDQYGVIHQTPRHLTVRSAEEIIDVLQCVLGSADGETRDKLNRNIELINAKSGYVLYGTSGSIMENRGVCKQTIRGHLGTGGTLDGESFRYCVNGYFHGDIVAFGDKSYLVTFSGQIFRETNRGYWEELRGDNVSELARSLREAIFAIRANGQDDQLIRLMESL